MTDNNQDRSQDEGQQGIDRETEQRNRENETGQQQNQQFGQDRQGGQSQSNEDRGSSAFGQPGQSAGGDTSVSDRTGQTGAWETAVLYHLVHGLAAFMVGTWRAVAPAAAGSRWFAAAGLLWIVGVVLFCGSLYGLSTGGPRWLGPVTPVGGTAFLAGWLCAATGAWRARPRAPGKAG